MLTLDQKQTIINDTLTNLELLRYRKFVEEALLQAADSGQDLQAAALDLLDGDRSELTDDQQLQITEATALPAQPTTLVP